MTPAWLTRRLASAHLARARRRFLAATKDVGAVQQRLLRVLLAGQASCAYGREHGFAAHQNLRDYQRQVPVVDYDSLAPWLRRALLGEAGALTSQPVDALRAGQGAHGTGRPLPETAGLRQQLAAGVNAWLGLAAADAAADQRWLSLLPGHAALPLAGAPSPSRSTLATLAGGRGPGWAAEGALSGPLAESCRAVLTATAGDPTVSTLVAAHPGQLVWLLDSWQQLHQEVLAALPDSRARAVQDGLARAGHPALRALWPGLRRLACQSTHPAPSHLPRLDDALAGIEVCRAPSLSAEGLLTVPHQGAAALAATSHFFEFLDLDDATVGRARRLPRTAAELQVGAHYLPVISTQGGLYRYQTRQALRCVGHLGTVPLLDHVGQTQPRVAIARASLAEHQLARLLHAAGRRAGCRWDLALWAPRVPPTVGLCLYLDTPAPDPPVDALAGACEAALRDVARYREGRLAGTIAPIKVQRVRGGWGKLAHALESEGVAVWGASPTTVVTGSSWSMVFAPTTGAPASHLTDH